jgi:hypothetical protein
MRLTNNTAPLRVFKKLAFYSCLCAALLFQGCNRLMESETQFRSHKITIARHGSSHEFYTEEQDGEDGFHYTGHSLACGKFDVVIRDEEVIVNGKVYGQLHKGDSVNIGDNGVTVNSLNEVETAQYFQTNSE